ncbi:DUF4241 domain-containing protein [Methylobacter sp. BBA5.1]|uniref:DUF4241 domain-containing protein n=1 Tax=Methylobacter sp. BBA5.1 TaxID=1495064 RepID=UPI0009DF9C91|nr:DUF4241 domain-containing protein [Methylobacter sp. BBA5.1]
MLDLFANFKPSIADSVCQTIDIGKLHLPSGRIFCCDPFLSDEVNALDITVAPGSYDVKLCIASLPEWGKRVALAGLIISKHAPMRWQEATYSTDGEQLSGFPVDAGLACFMDQETRQRFIQIFDDFYTANPDGNYYDDVLADEFKLSADPNNPHACGDWTLHYPSKDSPINIAMFASGLGDGYYQAFWGMDFMDRPAMLIIDFGLLEN